MRYVLVIVAVLCYPTVAWTDGHLRKLGVKQQHFFTLTIQELGFNCPLAKVIRGHGYDSFGKVIQIYCGPKDGDDVYLKGSFRITLLAETDLGSLPWMPLPGHKIKVAPWR